MDLNKLRRRDLEQLSAYIDGELSENDARQVEERVAHDTAYSIALQELKNTHNLVSELPTVRPPRNFTLTAEMAGIKRGLNLFPVFRFATVIATAAFAVLVGADALLLRGGALLAQEPELARLVAVEEMDAAGPIEEEVEGLFEAPLEDAVIGAELNADETIEADSAAPDAMALPTEASGTAEGLGLPGIGTDPGEGFAGEATKVETTATPMPRATQIATDDEQSAILEPPSVPPVDVETEVVEEVEPTQEPDVFEEPRPVVDPFRIAEIGLGALALLSAAITLILRRAR
jgi:hypothetical protein